MSTEDKDKNQQACSFCGQGADIGKNRQLIRGQKGFICTECVYLCLDLIEKEQNNTNPNEIDDVLSNGFKPSTVMKFLEEYVIGQNEAKTVLATAIYNHYKMIKYKTQKSNKQKVELEKSNILLLGPTGVGKTHIVKTIARMLNVPIAISDATNLTAAG